MTPLPTLVQSLRFDDKEYFSTPQVNRGLQALNRCIGSLSDGRISPVRFQTKPANLRSCNKHEFLYAKIEGGSRNSSGVYCPRTII